jgi:hypothetical protein
MRAAKRDEDGATLMLALVFLFVIGLVVISLGSTTSNGILNSTNLEGQRSIEYAADGATSIAVQSVRFVPTTYPTPPSTPTNCLPGTDVVTHGGSAASTDIFTSYVVCNQPTDDELSAISRVVDFYTCVIPGPPPQSPPTCNGTNSVLSAIVTFDDFATSNNVSQCQASPTLESSTCGSAMTINSWVLNTASH